MTLCKTVFSLIVPIVAGLAVVLAGTPPASARYTGSGPACVAGADEISVHRRKNRRSRVVGYLVAGQCGMNMEAVEGR